jgi:paired amphipathic helix protein Sin3a
MHDAYHTEIEEGEFLPDVGNIQLVSITRPGNGAASYDVAAPSEDGLSFRCSGSSICDHGNKSAVHHEIREGCNVEMDSLAYPKGTAEPHGGVKGGIPCCSLVVLLRLHQVYHHFILLHGPWFFFFTHVRKSLQFNVTSSLTIAYFRKD